MKPTEVTPTSELLSLSKENKRLVRENQKLLKEKVSLNHFLHTVSHNTWGPINTLSGLINVLLVEEGSCSSTEAFKHLKKTVQALRESMEDLTLIMDTQNNKKAWREISIEHEVDKICVMLAQQITDNQASIKVNMEGITHVYAIGPLFRSILLNLISNAIKYKSEDRSLIVTVSAKMVASKVFIEVIDNGIGIDVKRYEKHLFGLYKRFDNRSKEGRGVGLFLAKMQAEMMKGTLKVKSKLGQGCRFCLILPTPRKRVQSTPESPVQ